MSENEKILAESLSEVRAAIKKVTNLSYMCDKYGQLTKEGYEALETLEGLDLFWVCDPLIKLVSQKEKEEVYEPEYPCLYKGCVFVDEFGINKIVDVDDRGIRTAEQVIPKSVFIQAYNKFIKEDICVEQDAICIKPMSKEETKKLLQMAADAGFTPHPDLIEKYGLQIKDGTD